MRREAYVAAARAILEGMRRAPDGSAEQLALAEALRDVANGLLCELVFSDLPEEDLGRGELLN